MVLPIVRVVALLAVVLAAGAFPRVPVEPATPTVAGVEKAFVTVQGRGGARGGRGRGAVDTLGAGPWDLETETMDLHVTVVTKGLNRPWGMAFVPGGDILVTERGGTLRLIRAGILDSVPISGLPEIRARGLGGLLDIALHPDFDRNRWVYFVYNKLGREDPAHSAPALARGRWDGGATLSGVEDIFLGESFGGRDAPRGCCGQGPSDGNSLGSRISFDSDGYLYVTLGDRNYGEKAQDPASYLGKIVRLNDDGSIPEDNPFVGREGHLPAIFSLGHRNPLGLAFHPITGELWETEFGPRGGDELNRIEPGANYGWMRVTKGEHYDQTPKEGSNDVPGMTDPVLYWVPSINPGNIVFYDQDVFGEWRGNLLMAAMSRSLVRIVFDDDGRPVDQERMLQSLGQRFRDVRVGPDGLIYVLTDETMGAMLRIEPAAEGE